MRVCVVGSGPAGLYTSKYLLDAGLKVKCYEKNAFPYGLYKCGFSPFTKHSTSIFDSVLNHKNFKLKLNTEIKNLPKNYDAYVIAKGSDQPRKANFVGNEHMIQALEIVKLYNNCLTKTFDFGKKVLIYGCGNVSMDIIRYLFSLNVKKISVISRNGPFATSFTNNELRNVFDTKDLSINYNLDLQEEFNKYKKLLIQSNLNDLSKEIINKHPEDITRVYLCQPNKILKNVSHDNKSLAIDKDVDNFYSVRNKSQDLEENDKITFKKNKENQVILSPPYKEKYLEIDQNSLNSSVRDQENFEYASKKDYYSLNTAERRYTILNQTKNGTRRLNFLFYSDIDFIGKDNKRSNVFVKNKEGLIYQDEFDSVISSIGFLARKSKLEKSKKPIVSVGWCKLPYGNLNDIKTDAYKMASKIIETLKSKYITKSI